MRCCSYYANSVDDIIMMMKLENLFWFLFLLLLLLFILFLAIRWRDLIRTDRSAIFNETIAFGYYIFEISKEISVRSVSIAQIKPHHHFSPHRWLTLFLKSYFFFSWIIEIEIDQSATRWLIQISNGWKSRINLLYLANHIIPKTILWETLTRLKRNI